MKKNQNIFKVLVGLHQISQLDVHDVYKVYGL
jgi:hypothetical protein